MESRWLDLAREFSGLDDMKECLSSFEEEIRSLSDAFTKGRAEGFRGYATSRRSWLAYGLFFHPQTFARIDLILRELMARHPARFAGKSSWRVLDLGAGAGAASHAIAANLSATIQATWVDSSSVAMELGKAMAEPNKGLSIEAIAGNLREPPAGPFDLVVASYALNEAFGENDDAALDAWLARAVSTLAADGILILCEPLVYTAGQRMARLRSLALQKLGCHVLAPCLHQKACPLASQSAWCHDVRYWELPPGARYLNQRLHRSIQDLTFSFLALSKAPATESNAAGDARIVAPVRWLKGRWEMTGCAGDGSLHTYEVLARGFSAEQKERLNHLERGDVVHLDIDRVLGDPPRTRATLR